MIEFIFIIDLILHFFTEYPSEGGKTLNEDSKPVRDIQKIGKRYINTTFLIDLIACIPFNFFIEPARVGEETLNSYDYYYLIYLLKTLRLNKGMELFSPQYFN